MMNRKSFAALAALALIAVPASPASEQAVDSGTTRHLIGHSVQGREIYAYQRGDSEGRPVLIVGAIHGDERGGIAVAKRLLEMPVPEGVDLWVILELNPDGFVAGTRENARGVDLNRNFPVGWRSLPGGASGPRSLSEPESRAAARLIRRIRPRLSIWFHQPLGLVDGTRRQSAAKREFARRAGLPLRRLSRYPGTATSFERHVVAGAVAFVAELRGGKISARQARRYARAVFAVSDG